MKSPSEKTVGLMFVSGRILQWSSAAIVMGISSYFIAKGPRDQHALYWEILVGSTHGMTFYYDEY